MARDRNDRTFNPIHDIADAKRPAYEALGVWNGDTFSFHSPQHERDWRRQAYRQTVRDDRWHKQPPVDHRTQTLLDDKPEIGEGQFYRGPDGKHRRITMDQREDADVQAIRRAAFDDFAKTGVTWTDLAAYDDDKPHPGEEEAIALSQANKNRTSEATRSVNMKRGMDVLPEIDNSLTRFTGDLDLGLEQLADPWSSSSVRSTPPAILVANNAKAVSVPAWLKGFSEPTFGGTKGRTTTPKQRQEFLESLIGKPANDNTRSTKIGTSVAPAPAISAAQGSNAKQPIYHKSNVGAGDANDPTSGILDPTDIYYRARHDKANPPTAKEVAIYTISDEGRFSYLEDMKDEWSRLVEAQPIAVLESMKGEVDKLSHYSNMNFFSAFHRPPTITELAEINDVVEKAVFAPAEHWTDAARSPNHRGGEVAPKPYVALLRPQILTGNELAGLLEQAGTIIVQSSVEKEGGRLGSRVSREDVELITKKLAAAIKACGGNVTAELYASKEPQVQYIRGQVRQSRYPDSGVPFEINGRSVAPFVTHYTPKADGISMITREAEQLRGLVVNLARAIYHGELGIDAAGIGSIPKRAKGQTNEEYEKLIDGLIKDMIDCRRPFLIKLDIDPLDIETSLD